MVSGSGIYTDFQGFTELRKEAREESPEAIKKVAQQFESLFVQMMLKSMRDTVPEGGLFGGHQQRMYQDMFDKQLSLNVSTGKGIGLAQVIERQLTREQGVTEPPGALQDYLNSPVPAQQVVAQVSAATFHSAGAPSGTRLSENTHHIAAPEDVTGEWQNPEDFVEALWPYAVRAGNQLGVDPEALIAQSALETGWGQHVRNMTNGDNSYSLFGIKADQRWQGKTVSVSTLEFRHGAMQREQAMFRAYDSVGEAFEDYVDFIQTHPRYQRALENGFNSKAYARELQEAGYATDPDYAKKINRVRNSELLRTQVSALKNDGQVPLT